MKNNFDITGHWKGIITYGPEYEDWENKELYFSVDLFQDNDIINGIASDTGGIGVNYDKAKIKGFIENYEISFIKQYDTVTWTDETGEITDIEKPGPEINYTGTYNPISNSFEGQWEICILVRQIGDTWLDEVWTGTWTMTRK